MMASKKRILSLEGTAADSSPNKQRINEEPDQAASFIALNNDCLVHILTFLPAKDMNAVAECNRACHVARSSDLLDQDRTGTIVWTNRTTLELFCNKLQEVQEKFVGNRKGLKIEGLEGRDNFEVFEGTNVRLEQVKSLDCSVPDPGSSPANHPSFLALSHMLPNLQSLDFSNAKVSAEMLLEPFVENCRNLSSITWKRSNNLLFCGSDLKEFMNLTQLYLDDSMIWKYVASEEGREFIPYTNVPDCYLLKNCKRLERLSIKGARVEEWEETPPLSQEMLIKMVRRHPTLRWLRSDLTAENVAMLKQERPEITFLLE